MKNIFALIFLVVAFTFTKAQVSDYPAKLPDFEFIKIKGEGKFSNKNLSKNKQALIGFVSPTCIHCLVALEHLNNNFDKLENTDVVLVTVYDKEEFIPKLNEVAPKLLEGKNVTILQDVNGDFGADFLPKSIPTFYIYDSNGNLITVKKGSVEVNEVFNYLK